jgi:branched-chain amino acid transport system ATP-binding protein
MLLEIENLHVSYGAIKALQGISLTVNEGEIIALIGGNGAGKSTTLNTISGLYRPTKGYIKFQEQEITTAPSYEIVSKGVVQVPEGRKIFPSMTVLENLEMGGFLEMDKATRQKDIESIMTRFPRLAERRNQAGGTLSGGEQQMLAIGRGLMAHPHLLLLDEPSMGLSPILVEQIFEIIQEINLQGVSILLVEQNAQMALAIANRAYVLETGRIVVQGEADQLMHDPMVLKAYLGG